MAKQFSVNRLLTLSVSMAAITFGLTACSPSTGIAPSVTSMESQPQAQDSTGATGEPSKGGEKTSQKAFSRFPDIPIPTSAEMDVKSTLIFGAGDSWFGQLSLNTRHDTNTMFDFYKQELPSFGWQEITSVRALVSVLTYERQNRVLSIRLEKASLGGAIVTLVVSPRGTNTSAR